MTAQDDLVGRIRGLLGDAAVREVAMFGGRSLMVNDRMIVSVRKGGDLLVRVDPGHDADLLSRRGASRGVMGAGRAMAVGWIAVSADAIDDEGTLSSWLDAAIAYNRSVAGDS
jgi:TfoX/Sxy family transcriptional regulator of competence genes